MDALSEFKRRIATELAAAQRRSEDTAPAADYMALQRERNGRFVIVAKDLLATCIGPRLKALAGFFENAEQEDDIRHRHAVCWFTYSSHFPATTKLEFNLAHDASIEYMTISYELSIMPTFMKYDRHDRLVVALSAIDQSAVATWMEDKLVEFVRSYLRLEQGRDQGQILVTDPVCGMRIAKATAAAHSSFKGHDYYFCSRKCASDFEAEPDQYVTVEMY